jgi:hypothetical protein
MYSIDLWCPQAQEAELQKLLQVHLKLPSTALWFEPPTIGEPQILYTVLKNSHTSIWEKEK